MYPLSQLIIFFLESPKKKRKLAKAKEKAKRVSKNWVGFEAPGAE